ncbi:MAG: hypothetical protein C0469_10350 [Cyanobacteria bacterium DS2.3.42]|nr:hypothetical protein [Cyanobacteria bacterium DS2.3.42]
MVEAEPKQLLLRKVNAIQLLLLCCGIAWQGFIAIHDQEAEPLNLQLLSIAFMVVAALVFCRNRIWCADRSCALWLLGEYMALFLIASFGTINSATILFILSAIKTALVFDGLRMVVLLALVMISRGLAGELNSYLVQKDIIDAIGVGHFLRFIPVIRKIQIPFIAGTVMSVFLFRAVVAEQRSRLTAEQLKTEVDELALSRERERIARDIHDSLGHTLTTLNTQLDVALLQLSKDSNQVGNSLRTSKLLARQCLTDVRKALRTIKEPDISFVESVERLIATNQNSIPVTLACDGISVSGAMGHNLFCIAQEALTNIYRHSGAQSATIGLTRQENCLRLEIADDGVGFQLEANSGGSGLSGMQYRAESLGGTFCILSAPNQGARVIVVVPISA